MTPVRRKYETRINILKNFAENSYGEKEDVLCAALFGARICNAEIFFFCRFPKSLNPKRRGNINFFIMKKKTKNDIQEIHTFRQLFCRFG